MIQSTKTDALLTVEGIIIGFGEAISTNFDTCFDDSNDIISKTKEAI